MKKRILSMLLAIVMVVGMLPTFTLTASAATYTGTTYAVSIATDIENGTVTASPTSAAEGDTVTLTVSAANCFELDTLTVSNGTNAIETTAGENNTYTFKMPAANVTVSAIFKVDSKTLIFYANNGTDQTYVLNTSSTGMLPTDSECGFTAPEGKVLMGWARNSVSGAMKLAGKQGYYTVSAGAAFYAIWTDPVASVTVGGTTTNYGNLVEAFSAADGKTAEIKLLSEWDNSTFAEHPQIKSNASKVIFDLNGHKITNSSTYESNALEFAGECVIKNGEIEFTGGGQYIVFYSNAKNSKLTINGDMKITNTNRYGSAVLVSTGGNTVVVEAGAEITVPKKDNSEKTGAICLYTNATLIVNGGTISSTGTQDTDIAAYSTSNTNTTVVVNGGDFDTVKADNVYFNVNHAATVTANVTSNAWYKLTNSISADVAETAYTVDANTTVYDETTYGLAGGTVSLTATPASGVTVSKILANDTEATRSEGAYSFTMPNKLVTLTAESSAAIHTYTVTITESTNGSVKADKTTAAAGETVTLTITPADGYELNTLTVTDADGNVNDNQFIMPAGDVTIEATFKRVYNIIIADDIQNGTLTADKYVAAEGERVTLTATPNDGYVKGQYSTTLHGYGSISLSGDVLTMPACDVTVSVTFVDASSHAVWVPSNPAFSVKRTNDTTYPVPNDGSYSFTVNINSGYEKTEGFIVKAGDKGSSTKAVLEPDGNGVYTINNVAADQDISVIGVYPCKPDSTDDLKSDSYYPFTFVCKDDSSHVANAPYYDSNCITNIGDVYGNVNTTGWRCDVTFNVAACLKQVLPNHIAVETTPETAIFMLRWDINTKKWSYLNEAVTYAVTECNHSANTNRPTDNNDGTHSLNCSVCGSTIGPNEHDYTTDGVCACGAIGVTLKGSSLLLEGNIGLKLYFQIDETIFDDTEIELALADGRTFEYAASEGTPTTIDETTLYVFTCEVYAKQMADTVTVKAMVNGNAVQTYEHSVRNYAETLIANAQNAYTDAQIALVKAMLNYGTAAQLNFDYNKSDLANNVGDLMTEAEKTAYASVAKDVFDNYAIKSTTVEGLGTFTGANLVLESETTLNAYFQPEDGVDIDTLTFTVDGKTITPTKSGNYYVIAITKIRASDLDKVYTISVTNGTTNGTFAVSAFGYCCSVMNRETDDIYTNEVKNVLKALYCYNAAANVIFDTAE